MVRLDFNIAARTAAKADSGYTARKMATTHWMYCASLAHLDHPVLNA